MSEIHWREIIRRPIITEKTTYMGEIEQYAFEVHPTATKATITAAVEQAFPGTVVEKVRVMNMPAKRSRRGRAITIRKAGFKKAIVTLSEGTIDLFEGV